MMEDKPAPPAARVVPTIHITHGGPSDRYEHMREQAFIYAFILDRLGMND